MRLTLTLALVGLAALAACDDEFNYNKGGAGGDASSGGRYHPSDFADPTVHPLEAKLHVQTCTDCHGETLDGGSAQTARVQAAQRAAWAGQARAEVDLERWQDAQRLLEPLKVVIPFAPLLRFPARTSQDRRGNNKLLGLVAAHALLHQRQRGIPAVALQLGPGLLGESVQLHRLGQGSGAGGFQQCHRQVRALELRMGDARGDLQIRQPAVRHQWIAGSLSSGDRRLPGPFGQVLRFRSTHSFCP